VSAKATRSNPVNQDAIAAGVEGAPRLTRCTASFSARALLARSPLGEARDPRTCLLFSLPVLGDTLRLLFGSEDVALFELRPDVVEDPFPL
jgi:hypothetical protein